MKKFVFLTYGFTKPTPEIMDEWGKWLESIKVHIADMGHFSSGREISNTGTVDLPLGLDSITGFMIINADNLEEAEKMAQSNLFITSIRIYELRTN